MVISTERLMKKYSSKTLTKSTYKIFAVGLFLFLFSCTNNDQDKELEIVFEKMADKINPEKLNSFKLATFDSTCKTLEMISTEIDLTCKDISKIKKLSAYLDSIPRLMDSTTRKTYLTVAFHEYLNGGDIHGDEFKNKFESALTFQADKTIRAYAYENERIARKNYETVNIGDSLSLVLPVDNNFGHPFTFFKLGYPYSNDYSTSADDTLILKGVLIDKFPGENKGLTLDSTCLSFKVKIIEVSDTSVQIGNKNGNQFSFCLQLYGRHIKHW